MFCVVEVSNLGKLRVLFPTGPLESDSEDSRWLNLVSAWDLKTLKETMVAKDWAYMMAEKGECTWVFACPSELETGYSGFFHKIVENSHDEIYVCDGEGRTLYANKTFEQNYGLSRELMLGKTAMYLVEHGYSDQSPVPNVIQTKQAVTLNQRTVMGKNLMITATPYLDRQGEIAFIVENCRDTTELEAIRQQLERKSQEAERYKQEAEHIRNQEGPATRRVFESPKMRQVMQTAERVAVTDATVMVLGESGSGKSFIAKAIHRASKRSEKPFITVNCSTIPPNLFESEMFGYASGAFTGASSKGKLGQVALAEGGTLFLDEIGEVPLALQAKLLELIQEKRYMPVGDTKMRTADIRIIAATNRDLQELVLARQFREDLYYRLKVIEIAMPPLRDRREDIDGLLDVYLERFNQEYGMHKQLSPEVRRILHHYQWPGNVRELQNLVHSLVIMSADVVVSVTDLPGALIVDALPAEGDVDFGDLDHLLATFEQAIVQRCYQHFGSSYKVAKALNISQSRASRLIRRHV